MAGKTLLMVLKVYKSMSAFIDLEKGSELQLLLMVNFHVFTFFSV